MTLTLQDGSVLTKCDQCRQIYSERTPPEEPPCATCRVDLFDDNEDAARIFQIVRRQVVTRFNGQVDVVIDINHVALWQAIDGYGVRDRRGCFEKVLRLFHELLREQE
jgi:hypothetical protein